MHARMKTFALLVSVDGLRVDSVYEPDNTCQSQVVDGRFLIIHQGSPDICKAGMPRVSVPFNHSFQPRSTTCSEACSEPDDVTWGSAGSVAGRGSLDVCRVCLRDIFGVVNINRPQIPTTKKLKDMETGFDILGHAACCLDEDNEEKDSDFCEVYKKLRPNQIAPPGYLENAAKILARNRAAAEVAGFGKLLIISSGATFRKGGNGSTPVDSTGVAEDAAIIDEQKEASTSHVDFAKYLKYAFGIETDFLVNTYQTPLSDQLTGYYPAGTEIRHSIFNPSRDRFVIFNEGVRHADTRAGMQLDEYPAVFFIRPDLILKQGLFTSFELFEKMDFWPAATRSSRSRRRSLFATSSFTCRKPTMSSSPSSKSQSSN